MDNFPSDAGVFITNTHNFNVELGAIPFINWEKGEGELEIKIPYDGRLLQNIKPYNDKLYLGTYNITKNGKEKVHQQLPIELPLQQGNASSYFKTAKTAVFKAEYDVTEPTETLFTIDSKIIDIDELLDKIVNGDIDSFKNELKLAISIWTPDHANQAKKNKIFALEKKLIKRDIERQVFIPHINPPDFGDILAESMCALANSSGGTIFIGVNNQKEFVGFPPEVIDQSHIEYSLLRAALRCSPPVPLTQPVYFEPFKGEHVALVDVPSSIGIQHKLKGRVYFRKKGKNTHHKKGLLSKITLPPLFEQFKYFGDYIQSTAQNYNKLEQDKEVTLDFSQRWAAGKIGPEIVKLINSSQTQGRIIVKCIRIPKSRSRRPFFKQKIWKDFHDYIKEEVDDIRPKLKMPNIYFQKNDDTHYAFLKFNFEDVPAALYKNRIYLPEQDDEEKESPKKQVFERYVNASNIWAAPPSSNSDTTLIDARLDWPIQPSNHMPKEETLFGNYDIQNWAMAWKDRSFEESYSGHGFEINLLAHLHQVLLDLNGDDNLISKEEINTTGTISFRLENYLTSELSLEPIKEQLGNGPFTQNLLDNLPIYKQTIVNLNITIRLKELFQERIKTAVLNFKMLDVNLNQQRVNDLRYICEDLGFKIPIEDVHVEVNQNEEMTSALLMGTKNTDYLDLDMAMGIQCDRIELKRELRFDEKRIDTKNTQSATLNFMLAIRGTGDDIGKHLSAVQFRFLNTIQTRLHHLRTE